jgi:C4-dicarboxylate transporter DctM subunit
VIGEVEAAIGFCLMLALLFLGLHVGIAMLAVGMLGAFLFLGKPIINAFGTQLWSASENFVLLAIPLYILLGEILVRGGVTDRMYKALANWLNPLPGGLLHTNIGASALFSAVSGSSVATAATISTVALPAFRTRSYDPRLVLGTIAAGASLGNLIPPGINLIIYGAMTNTSVGRLYAAGVVPGILLALLFMATIVVLCLYRPAFAGTRETVPPLPERLRSLLDLSAPFLIFVVVMGSIYAGWATATEAAAFGVFVALPFAAMHGKLNVRMLNECFVVTVNLTAMMLLIVAMAFYLNFVMGILGIPQALARYVAEIGASPTEMKWILFVFYVVLGTFMETLPMLIGTVPVVFPLITGLGIDPVWFGIFLCLMCEISLITPPVGMTLYVIQGVRREGTMREVIEGTTPFFVTMLIMSALLIHFPDLALWLPALSFD